MSSTSNTTTGKVRIELEEVLRLVAEQNAVDKASAGAAAAAAAAPTTVVIDARSAEEFEYAHMPGVYNVPLSEFEEAFTQLSAEEYAAKYKHTRPVKGKDKVVLFCFSGLRAGKCCDALVAAGWSSDSVLWYEGGHREWLWSQLPPEVLSPAAVSPTVCWDCVKRVLDLEAYKKSTISGFPAALILDVRSREETKTDGAIPNSVNIPLGDLEAALTLARDPSTFPNDDALFTKTYNIWAPATDQPIIVVCWAGGRAAKAVTLLHQFGYSRAKVFPGSTREFNWYQLPDAFQDESPAAASAAAGIVVPLPLVVEHRSHPGLMLLDLRSKKEDAAALVPGAGCVPASDIIDKGVFEGGEERPMAGGPFPFKERFGFFRPPTGQPIVLFGDDADSTGEKSSLLAKVHKEMTARGYTRVRILKEGAAALLKAIEEDEESKKKKAAAAAATAATEKTE